jgi:gallate decarboxylase subunit D
LGRLNVSQRSGLFKISHKFGREDLIMTAWPMGEDLCVTLTGGTRKHIGAVSVSQPRYSLACVGKISSTTSVITLLGHKEDDLAKYVGGRMSYELNSVVCVACGIHIENISEQEMQTILENVKNMTQAIINKILSQRQV